MKRTKKSDAEVDDGVEEMTQSFKIISDLISILQQHQKITGLKCVYSWRTIRSDIIDKPRKQKKNDCWTYGLSRGQSSLVKLKRSSTKRLRVKTLKNGVHSRDIHHDGSLLGFGHLTEFMKESHYVKEIIIHRRYKTDHPNKSYDDFEDLLKELLAKGPVAVAFECLPSYDKFSGRGVYYPTELVYQVKRFEKFTIHVGLATGHGVEVTEGGEIIEFLEFQDSRGKKRGDMGFIRLALHKRLFKHIFELKV